MLRIIIALAVLSTAACRNRDDDRERELATGLAGAPPVEAPAAESKACPAGSERKGAPRPRGSGQWCEKIAGGRIQVFRLDGTLWADGSANENGMQGEIKFYAPDGRVAMVRRYVDNHTEGDDDIRIPGVELPPTILSACTKDSSKPPSTTPCAPQ